MEVVSDLLSGDKLDLLEGELDLLEGDDPEDEDVIAAWA